MRRADTLNRHAGLVLGLLGDGAPLFRQQQAGSVFFFFVRLLLHSGKFLLHFLEGRALLGQSLLRREKHGLALSVDHALIERGVVIEPADPVNVAFLGGHLVEKAHETAGIVARVPGVLDAELVGLQFIFAADAQQLEVQHQP